MIISQVDSYKVLGVNESPNPHLESGFMAPHNICMKLVSLITLKERIVDFTCVCIVDMKLFND